MVVATAGSSLGAALEAGLGDLVPLQLARSATQPVHKNLVPHLVEEMKDNLPTPVAEHIRDYLLFKLTPRITFEVSARLAKELSKTVPKNVKKKKELCMWWCVQIFPRWAADIW